MASGLLNIVKKEIREMVRDPRLLLGMIIVPLIMFPLMGVAMNASMSTVEDSAHNIQLGAVNLDEGQRSGDLLDYLENRSVTVISYAEEHLDAYIGGQDYGVDVMMLINTDFTSEIESNASGLVLLYTQMETYSISESIPPEVITGYVLEFQQKVLNERMSVAFPGQDVLLVENPVLVASVSVVKGEVVNSSPGNIAGQMMSQSIMMPMILMILLIMAAQLAATSVAMEKEEKTLETLLTMPVSRSSILFGKISGVIVVSAIAVVAYIFGFTIYMNSMMAMTPDELGLDLADIGLVPTTTGLILLFITLFLSLIAALSLAVLTASFTEDVRSAQALMGVLYVPIFVPALVLMFVDVSQLPTVIKGVILAIPFTYPTIASKALYTSDFFLVIVGIIYQIIFTAVVIFAAAKLFSSEKILTARLSFKGRGGFPIINLLSRKKGR